MTTTSSVGAARSSLTLVSVCKCVIHCSGIFTAPFSAWGLPLSAGPAKTKTPIDLFANDDEDGDIFSEKFSAPAQSKKDAAAESGKHPEKKVNLAQFGGNRIGVPMLIIG